MLFMPARPVPRNGDVLVSHHGATRDYSIAVVPKAAHVTCASYERAMSAGRQLAQELQVDVWLTVDNRHFLPLASFRT
jgi:hypothetical protein